MSDRYIDSITAGLAGALADDDSVILLGEDITYGGPFGATRGLVDTYGSARVIDTPISEATIMGTAIGAAATGMRPVLEIMFLDFMTLAMDQLVNHAAKLRFMTGGQLQIPLTIRVQGGVSGLMGAHHSQSLESWFIHVPGLKVVAPAFPADAERLLRAAIADNDPVIYLEHRGLYWTTNVSDSEGTLGAIVRRPGSDVTLVSYSKMLHATLEAAKLLEDSGVDAEVIDLRWLSPLDIDKVVESVKKTGYLLIVHEAVIQGGVGGEVAARVQEDAWGSLKGPIQRLGALFAPVGASKSLEAEFLPTPHSIAEASLRLIQRPNQSTNTKENNAS